MKGPKLKKPIFIRNEMPLPKYVPEFEISLSVDKTKITELEYGAIIRQAHIDAAEAWLLKQANDDPNGQFATTYFTRKED